jgi:hypothetical protein
MTSGHTILPLTKTKQASLNETVEDGASFCFTFSRENMLKPFNSVKQQQNTLTIRYNQYSFKSTWCDSVLDQHMSRLSSLPSRFGQQQNQFLAVEADLFFLLYQPTLPTQ